ncbi:ModD protein [Rhodoferax sp. 4810]|uniref:Putative pyrophosphorylase ModD n=1 Tax=Thiospirillum jenense TaxID=1653858 RepID=A0A839HD01_9GAMM|nr:ModD protein [Thiospirillum jenense]MBB1073532.1 ModD protein [Rhodoferax jenense]MBB1126020.1 ModD protein [Thiospirillum jenense]
MLAVTHCVLDDAALQHLLIEDVPYGDLTTEALAISERAARIQFTARDAMTVCGTEEARRLCELCGATATLHTPSGQVAPPGTLLLTADGTVAAVHHVWKTAQTLLEWCAGVATRAAAIQTAAICGHPDAIVAVTRKNVPGVRQLAVKACRAGGAVMHRCGLSETVLIFAEHRQFLGDESPNTTLARLRRQCPEKRIVVEVNTPAEALQWANADVLQLEKFTPAAVAEVVDLTAQLNTSPLIAAAGGIHADNAADYARAGARLLVTSAPHIAPPRDVQVRFHCA